MSFVYHYTTLEVLLSMLKNLDRRIPTEESCLSFWASSILSMNDPQEFLYGYKLLQDTILPEIERKMGIKDNNLKLSRLSKIQNGNDVEALNKAIIEKLYEENSIPYIVSFSENKDFLPMWNAYSCKGRGVCLCFKNNHYLIDGKNVDILNYLHAKKVTYGEVDGSIKDVVHSLYEKYIEEYKNDRDRIKKMLSYFATLAVTTSPYHKHKAYEYENEVRLVQFKKSTDNIKYRISKQGRLIPYIEVSVKLKYLEQIILGPCVDSVSIIRELRHMFDFYRGNEDNFIVPSEVPYREY